MSLVIKGQFGLIVDAVREKRPVIHHLTNYVTAGDCANITLCAGASPVMADEADEVAEITANADALVLNLGTIAKAKMQALEENQQAMREQMKGCVQKVKLMRYNAFADTGSDLSYSLSLLDENNNGVVLSSIYGREDNRTYAKPIENGKSTYNLSEEEKKVLP